MAKWAFWMLAATGTGVIVTGIGIFYLASTLAEARRSSDAAMIMAKAMIDIEVPILQARWTGIFLDGVDEPVQEGQGYSAWRVTRTPSNHSIISKIPFRNYGRTPAFLASIHIGFAAVAKLPERPVYIRDVYLYAEDIVRPEPQEDAHAARVHFCINLNDPEVSLLKSGEADLWLYFLVKYRDFMNRPHEAGFCFRWAQRPKGEGGYHFRSDGDPPAEYTRRS